MRCFFDSVSFLEFVHAKEDREIEKTDEQLQMEMERAKSTVWTTKGLHECEDMTSDNEEVEGEDGTIIQSDSTAEGRESEGTITSEIVDPADARDFLQRCHLVVGFHPDQAAGDIVDFAVARNIPWCMVPCCVYSETFTQRKLKDGTNVKSYDHLVKWLCEKDQRARIATLDLEGKNTVVYTLPK